MKEKPVASIKEVLEVKKCSSSFLPQPYVNELCPKFTLICNYIGSVVESIQCHDIFMVNLKI